MTIFDEIQAIIRRLGGGRRPFGTHRAAVGHRLGIVLARGGF